MIAGQWIGTFEGGRSGEIILDLDRTEVGAEGSAYLFDNDKNFPGVFAQLRTNNSDIEQILRVGLTPLHPYSGEAMSIEALRGLLPDVTFAAQIDVTMKVDEHRMTLEWTPQSKVKGSAHLKRSAADKPSEYLPDPDINCWEDFRRHAVSFEPRKFIFRGQSDRRRLRTSFHRTSRKDLERFMRNDIPHLHRLLMSRTRHMFDLSSGVDHGAFLNLIQHHGYPTPLLDWTHSPFVAAYFAFASPPNVRRMKEDTARIFMFDSQLWLNSFTQLQKLHFARQHFSLMEAYVIENERAIPQQALSSVTNVDDIETLIQQREATSSKSFLKVYDIPYSERPKILRELSLMGITEGSLFPGIEGFCKDARNRLFALDN